MIPTPALTLALALLMGHPGPVEGHPGPTTDDASPLVAVEVVARPAVADATPLPSAPIPPVENQPSRGQVVEPPPTTAASEPGALVHAATPGPVLPHPADLDHNGQVGNTAAEQEWLYVHVTGPMARHLAEVDGTAGQMDLTDPTNDDSLSSQTPEYQEAMEANRP